MSQEWNRHMSNETNARVRTNSLDRVQAESQDERVMFDHQPVPQALAAA
jgi:hypothetical protein